MGNFCTCLASVLAIGSITGALYGGYFSDKFGR